jgi:hypothetical protein
MNAQPTADLALHAPPLPGSPGRIRRALRTLWRTLRLPLVLFVTLCLLGSGAPDAREARYQAVGLAVAGHVFDLVEWQVAGLSAKARAWWEPPAAALSEAAGVQLVRDYLARGDEIRAREVAILGIRSGNGDVETDETRALQAEIDALRAEQLAARPAVEQVVERQVGSVIAAEGIRLGGTSFPPVLFSFAESPRKLVVSPRERIATEFYRMVDPAIGLEEVERIEQAIEADGRYSAYVARTGGLGAYPSMVLDDASLPWLLSTVAHEWVHNYLTLFPLGLLYGAGPEMTTINETVAEIAGDELGARVLARYYPDLVPPDPEGAAGEAAPPLPAWLRERPAPPPPFDFAYEMRLTRLTVDELLAAGRVEEVEAYMEQRRQVFVRAGYPIRRLNQGYFAFHGSYATSPGSSSPIGPELTALRAWVPDLRTFLHAVRTVTSPEAYAALIEEWQAAAPASEQP